VYLRDFGGQLPPIFENHYGHESRYPNKGHAENISEKIGTHPKKS